ncbi:hypothetical protein [Aurantimonas sp. Leaf443]|uniref:hypothetical protein n=1 Tax=Aurantimonas sp. Leaf443 TaxID=1736378 RepID=UPI0006F88E5B|nr:hypothetical protein [Aurantimonas sp. Leaf443]KQT82442.1 hypothetical protein ASG48_15320 [Aurantimonas sp. Leaf443]
MSLRPAVLAAATFLSQPVHATEALVLKDEFATRVVAVRPGVERAPGAAPMGEGIPLVDPMTTGNVGPSGDGPVVAPPKAHAIDAETAARSVTLGRAGAGAGEADGPPRQPYPVTAEAASEAGAETAAPAAAAEPDHAAAPEHGGEGHAAAPPATRQTMPFDIVRTIQFLQDQVAYGNGRAIRVQALLLQRFAPVFLQMDPAIWKDPRNLRAGVLFTLSGGTPDLLERLQTSGALDESQKALVDGATAYVRNDLKRAETQFAGLDLSTLEPGLAAHLNLVLGQIRQTDAPAIAVAHLDRARLLAPGGLIEEAALRLEAMIVDGLGDHARADSLARQYFDRYAGSSYAANFQARFVATYAARQADPDEAMATMTDLIAALPDADRRGIYLAAARRTLVAGNLRFAELAADAALATAGATPADLERARLYKLAATAGRSGDPTVMAEVASIDRAVLQPEDVTLLEAAHSVVDEIDRSIDFSGLEAEAGAEEGVAPSAVVSRAEQLLNEVSADLGKVQP